MIRPGAVVSLYGWYANDNLGDDLLLKSSLSILADSNCRVVLYGDKSRIEAILAGLPNRIREIVSEIRVRSAIRVIRDAFKNDVFMVGGGGIFPTRNYLKGCFYLLVAILYRIRGRKVLFAGLSIEEFNYDDPVMSRVVRGLIRFSTFFSLRDSFYARSTLPDSAKRYVRTTPDLVFSLPISNDCRESKKEVVFCCANIFTNSFEGLDGFVGEIVTVIDWLTDKGYSISLLSFSGSDEVLNRTIADHIDAVRLPVARVYTFDETCRCYSDVIGSASMAICMRFHSLVISQLMLCPYISISYSNKNSALLEDIGLEHWQVPFGTGADEYLNKAIGLEAQKIIDLLQQLAEIQPFHSKRLLDINQAIALQSKHAVTEIRDAVVKENG